MRTSQLIGLGLLTLALSAACGKSNDASPAASEATTSDIASYQQLASNVQNGASSYGAAMSGSNATTLADCGRIHDQYDGEVRPWVSQMGQMSGPMDRYMSDHGGANAADYACVSTMMMGELDRHRSAACASADLATNQSEVARHVNAMLSYTGHMWDRCDQMMQGTSSSSGWGPMMSGCQGWDGTCTSMMYDDCSNGMMGGMHGDCCY